MTHVTLTRLKRRAKRLGITHDRIAAAADVTRTTVVHTLAGRTKSANVVETVKRLIEEATQNGAPERLRA